MKTWNAHKGLQTIVRIQSPREIQGKATQETRYYISDEDESKAALDSEYLKQMMGI